MLNVFCSKMDLVITCTGFTACELNETRNEVMRIVHISLSIEPLGGE